MMAKYKSGLAGIFLDEHKLVKAVAQVRENGFVKFDAISPFPVHGMEEAHGIRRSWIPYVTFIAGLVGLTSGLLLTWWTSAVDWPLNVGGKPFFSLPAFIPVMFELTILFAALSSVGALFYACGIPRIDPPIIDPDLTSHKFAIFIPSDDQNYDEKKIETLLRSLGATEVRKAQH
ncbi:MAG: DUF3341 domain-containing protein [Bdellovibrio sp.]|nr:MAG: DUF3341 domain-containing protein [Bdellovibrio sp.]